MEEILSQKRACRALIIKLNLCVVNGIKNAVPSQLRLRSQKKELVRIKKELKAEELHGRLMDIAVARKCDHTVQAVSLEIELVSDVGCLLNKVDDLEQTEKELAETQAELTALKEAICRDAEGGKFGPETSEAGIAYFDMC